MRVFLDACVLYPPLVREAVIGVADAGLLTPFYSSRVLEEWRRAVLSKQGAEAGLAAEAAADALRVRFAGGEILPPQDLETTLVLPDPADTHVLAGAIAGQADTILTFNLRDFPRRALAPYGIEARHPDGFLWELLSREEILMAPVIAKVLHGAGIAPERARAAFKRARLARFGKAWEGTRSP